jgi:Tfp pilus assembly protein PilF
MATSPWNDECGRFRDALWRRTCRAASSRALLAGAAWVAALVVACAGGTEQQGPARSAESAALPASQGQPSVQAPAAALEGAGATDVPSGRDQKLGPRPRINAKAAQEYAQGIQAFARGDLRAARTQFLLAIQSDPKAYQAHYSLGVVRERLGDAAGAGSSYLKALTIVADYEPAIVAEAMLLATTNRADQAERFLGEQLAKMPQSAAIPAALSEVKSIQGDSGSAQRLAQEALKKNPDYRPAMLALARDHYRSRRLDLALYTLKGILDGFGPENPPRDKENAEAAMLRGLIYKEQGNRAGELEQLRRAVSLRPDLVEARLHLAVTLLEAGNADEAVQLLEMAARYDPNNVFVRLNLGDAYRLQGRADVARPQLEWVAAQRPDLAQVQYDLGLLYLFSESVPGVAPRDAAQKAIEALEKFKELRSRAEAAGDIDELITRAKSKKALIESESAEDAAATDVAPASAGAAAATPAPAGAAGAARAPAAATGAAPAAGALPAAPSAAPAKPQPEAKPASGAFPPTSDGASGQPQSGAKR